MRIREGHQDKSPELKESFHFFFFFPRHNDQEQKINQNKHLYLKYQQQYLLHYSEQDVCTAVVLQNHLAVLDLNLQIWLVKLIKLLQKDIL